VPSVRKPSVIAAAGLASVALAVAGCGGSSSPGVAHLSSGKGAPSASPEGDGSSTESKASPEQAMLAFAKCMRSNGVPNFPDPNAGGGAVVRIPTGGNTAAPLFKAAQAKCQKLLPGGGLPGSGSPPSAQTLAHWLKVSQCMRKHGVSGFPDPSTSVPSKSGGGPGVVADREGAIFAIPATIMQSPAFTRAAAACGFGLHNH
jgi:hypothetical protein